MKTLRLLLTIATVCGGFAFAESDATQMSTLVLKDGREVQALSFRRTPQTLYAMVSIGPGVSAETGYPISQIVRLVQPVPTTIQHAASLIASGRAAELLSGLEPVMAAQSSLRDIPGNLWSEAALAKVNALLALNRTGEAETLLSQVTSGTANASLPAEARIAAAVIQSRTGKADKALAALEQVLADGNAVPSALARTWMAKGDILLAEKDYDSALLAYLRIPVLYPQPDLLPSSLLGAARSYRGLGDPASARSTLQNLITRFPDSPDAGAARSELKQLDPST